MAMMEAAAGRVLILKRAAANRPSGDWNDDDYDVLADGGRCRPHLEGSRGPGGNAVDVDAGLWPSRGPHADVRLRGVARDRDGGLRRELAAGMIEHLGINMPWTHWDIFASARRPASVIRTRTTSVCRPSATMRSRFVVASPALTSSTIMSIENPCARRIDRKS